jgi:N-hydroxyarylamine O-acetyltransferase
MALDLDAYFRRIGYDGSAAPTLATLKALQSAHPRTIPFENLDTFAGVPLALDLDSLERKLVHSRRGGYCFEQNTLFCAVLERLGFDVTPLAARVLWRRPPDELRPRSHMLLLVALPEGDYVCDVGFGGLTPTAPLRIEPNVEQRTPHETFRLLRGEREFVTQAWVQKEWRPLYRFDLQPQSSVDIEVLNFFVMAHPASPMRGNIIAARTEPDRRYALANREFSTYFLDGAQERVELESAAAIRAILIDVFRVDVPTGPAIDAALAQLLASG